MLAKLISQVCGWPVAREPTPAEPVREPLRIYQPPDGDDEQPPPVAYGPWTRPRLYRPPE